MRKICRPLLVVWLLTLFILGGVELATAAQPLLMPGKKTIFQKVITHPGAARHQAPGGPAQDPLVPFSVLYVYGRQLENGKSWLNCAGNSTGKDLFWLPGDLTSEWKQSLALVFSQRDGRQPLMFFKRKNDLVNLASSPGITNNLKSLAQYFADFRDSGKDAPDNFPVVAMEPDDEEGAVPYNHFYLMPIFSYDEQFDAVKLLEVGSIDPNVDESEEGDDAEKGGGPRGAGEKGGPPKDRPTTAFAFVIDTTISMGPYIDRCRDLTRDLYDSIEEMGQSENVALGVVAFRSSVIARPEIEYTTRIIAPLTTAMSRDEFEDALEEVEEAQASTHAYAEDSLAGLNTAIDKLDWKPYHGRVIFLITDAGPLPLEDPFNSIPATPDTIFEKAREKNIRIVTLHIKSPAGVANHMAAERAYLSLSFDTGGASTYVDIPADNARVGSETFMEVTDTIIAFIEEEVFSNEEAAQSQAAPQEKVNPRKKSNSKAANLGAILGHSIRLDYLGSKNKARAPRVVKSWIPDKDLANLDKSDPTQVRSVQVTVLLTKNQLSALARQLNIILTNAEKTISEQSTDFFKNILAASAQISRDPNQFTLTPSTKLGDLGLLGEFLEDLPYKSRFMGMTEADWYNMSPGEQDTFVRNIKALLKSYDDFDRDTDKWGKFDRQNDGEWLYRVPLSLLP
ncbi:MAG: VWA domain-containing protein [Deltaproteobacteria bacterium]|jgi:serine/threonine-protein kinase PpkA|nr:VWA domain-containing protein [Deltaproteobacteria bacterium]